jgi:hypothetical protein
VHLPNDFPKNELPQPNQIEPISKKPIVNNLTAPPQAHTTVTMSFSKKYTLHPPIRQQTQPPLPNPYETPMQTLRGAQTVHMSPELFEKLFLASSRTANSSGLQSQSSFHHDDEEPWRKPSLPSPTPMYVSHPPRTAEVVANKGPAPSSASSSASPPSRVT